LKKSFKDIVFSDSDQISAIKGCLFVLLTQFILLIFTIAFIFLIFNSSGFIRSFAIAATITNACYHVVALFNGIDDFGEYGLMKGVIIWYATAVIAVTNFIEIVF
jgi:hypothetical protein